jgi:translation elongation factor EF-Tu-like GTPase
MSTPKPIEALERDKTLNPESVHLEGTPFLTGCRPLGRACKFTSHLSFETSVNSTTLGHVDNGKTTLSAALSSASVKDIDRSKEEQERGITINTTTTQYRVEFLVKKSEIPAMLHGRIQNKTTTGIAYEGVVYRQEAELYGVAEIDHNDAPLNLSADDADPYVYVRATFKHGDAPGHRDYSKNTLKSVLTAANNADTGIAFIVVDISNTEDLNDQPQTLQHLRYFRTVGGKNFIVFFNKVDTEFPKEVADAIMEPINQRKAAAEGRTHTAKTVRSDFTKDEINNMSSASGMLELHVGMQLNQIQETLQHNPLPHEQAHIGATVFCSALIAASHVDQKDAYVNRSSKFVMVQQIKATLTKGVIAGWESTTQTAARRQSVAAEQGSIHPDDPQALYGVIDGKPPTDRGIVYVASITRGQLKVNEPFSIVLKSGIAVKGVAKSIEQFAEPCNIALTGDSIGMRFAADSESSKMAEKISDGSVIVANNTPYQIAEYLLATFYPHDEGRNGRKAENIIKPHYSGQAFIRCGNVKYAVEIAGIFPMYKFCPELANQETFLRSKVNIAGAAEALKANPEMTYAVPGDMNGYIVLLKTVTPTVKMLIPVTPCYDVQLSDLPQSVFLNKKDREKNTNKAAKIGSATIDNLVKKLNAKTPFSPWKLPEQSLTYLFIESDHVTGSGQIMSIIPATTA